MTLKKHLVQVPVPSRKRCNKMEDRFIIIDGNSLINRAYYAMQRPMITREGIYTQGLFGFLRMLHKLQKDYPYGYIGVAFDRKEPTFRHKMYDSYKEGRRPMPPELQMQMPLLKEILKAMGICCVEMAGWEADDIIGTLAAKGEAQGLAPLIITGDKDALQLATKKTQVLITKKGISDFDLFDEQAMVDVYGLTPAQFIDLKALMGDKSDNYPGIPGVGETTATKLLLQFGSLENLLDHTQELKGKLRERVENNVELARLSKTLATIATEVPLEESLEDFKKQEPHGEALLALYQKLEFNSFIRELDLQGVVLEDSKPSSLAQDYEKRLAAVELVLIQDPAGLQVLQQALASNPAPVGLVTQGNLQAIGTAEEQEEALTALGLLCQDQFYYVPLPRTEAGQQQKKALGALLQSHMAQGLAFGGADIKQDYVALMSLGLEDFHTAYDTEVAQYVIDPGRHGYAWPLLAKEYLGVDVEKDLPEGTSVQMDLFGDPVQEQAKESCRKAVVAQAIAKEQQDILEKEELLQVYEQVELPLIPVMAALEYTGFACNKDTLKTIGEGIQQRVETLTQDIYALAGEEFNIKSPQQLGVILFEKLGLPAGKKTKKGYSTGADILEKNADKHPIVPLILEYRTLTKLQGTYIEGLLPLVREDGRIHAHFNQTIAATGRISSSDPNLQNIPVRQELGRQIRRAFVPGGEDRILLSADYSQIELRILAHMSQDPVLIKAFQEGEDIHRATAANVLGVPPEDITPLERSQAKAINFGVIYGMSAFGLSSNLGITRKEAGEYIDEYFGKHAQVKAFMDDQVAQGKAQGFVSTLMGRKRYIKEINASNFMVRQAGERLAMNSPIQGTAADIIKLAMIRIWEALKPYRSRLILQVHDELIIETYKEEEQVIRPLLQKTMEEAMALDVPLLVDLGEGNTWFDLK